MTGFQVSPETIKRCCAAAYDHAAVRTLVGDALHPGGAQLTERLGRLLNLTQTSRVLDVASGRGDGALVLAARFGCEVVGLDFGRRCVETAAKEARNLRLADRVAFYCGDAERLPFADGTFDAVVCECALCTFPDKPTAVAEFVRVLKSGGTVGISDLTRSGRLPCELEGDAAWIACVADARPLDEYRALLASAGLAVGVTEAHDSALIDFVEAIRLRLFTTEIMVGLKKIDLAGIDLAAAKDIVRHALAAAKSGVLGYSIVTATKDAGPRTGDLKERP
ncbi:methyltransferase domain-containing protein [Roseiarcaceae bacterium H3SJ34-1]|uniref:class I SAM-dependent methyltransferase n=1 Tax=Terripilifer ovatus TaxID=3032367 RepID=UPI003AB95BB9|nr:methyltransferase domain-containing protein [Roseiarcaceae bacterium H3SJ34-1]